MLAAGSTGGLTSLWFLARGTGVVSLLLLTLVVAIGVANVRRLAAEGWPRFVVEAVHRNAGLLAVVFLVVHIFSSVLDPFTPIRLADAVIPFISLYRPIWLGLGAVAFDLMIAVVITSLCRRRIGYRSWRWVHWTAYACWPIAVVHGLGAGSDTKTKWMLALTAGCVLVVLAAALVRALAGWPSHAGTRLSGALACAALPIALLAWLPSGPLGSNWARRAGTPVAVLAAARTPQATGRGAASSGGANSGGASSGAAGASPSGNASFQGPVQGTVKQAVDDEGNASIHLILDIGGGLRLSQLHILIVGRPADGGGVQMTTSSVTLGPSDDPHEYEGAITALSGSNIAATVHDAAGHSYAIVAQLQLDPSNQTASGTVSATAGG